MPQKSPKITINLSSQGKDTLENVFYKWAVDAGRGIIIGIELIALAALGYRFVVDKQIVDLHDEIDIQEGFVQRHAEKENLYRSIQDRLENIKETDAETSGKVEVMQAIIEAISENTFSSTSLTVNDTIINLNGNTFSIFTLNSFIEEVKLYPSIASISIDEINTSDQGIKFKVRIDMKKMTKKAPAKT